MVKNTPDHIPYSHFCKYLDPIKQSLFCYFECASEGPGGSNQRNCFSELALSDSNNCAAAIENNGSHPHLTKRTEFDK